MSVGYGDISADNNRERMFALVTMVSSLTACASPVCVTTRISLRGSDAHLTPVRGDSAGQP